VPHFCSFKLTHTENTIWIKPLVEYKSFLYQAASWRQARRVVAKVEHHQGELFPRVGFIVTNLSSPSRAVVRFLQ
jgi:Transposase DDE domain group 1